MNTEILLPFELCEDMAQGGPVDASARYWIEDFETRKKLDSLDFDAICECLENYGAWTLKELKEDNITTLERFIWVKGADAYEQFCESHEGSIIENDPVEEIQEDDNGVKCLWVNIY